MALDPEEEQVEYWADYVAGGGDITRIPSNLRQAVMEYSQSGDWIDADLEGFEDDLEGAQISESYLAGRGMESGQGLDRVRGGEAGDIVHGMGQFDEMELRGDIGEFPGLHWRPESDMHSDAFTRFVKYLEGFSQSITKELWERAVLPPLRQAIGKIFTNQGFGEWNDVGEEWYAYKLNPPKQAMSIGGLSASRFKKIGLRTLDYRGTYRNTLTRRTGLNERGNVFRQLAGNEAGNFDWGAGAFGKSTSSGWHLGFQYGIDQEWFQKENRRRRGDDFEAEYPSSFEQDTDKVLFYTPILKKSAPKGVHEYVKEEGTIPELSKSAYIKYVRRVFLTGREAVKVAAQNDIIEKKNEDIRKQNAEIRKRELAKFNVINADIETEIRKQMIPLIPETPVIDAEGTVAARPLWAFFQTERPVVVHFKKRVQENLTKEIVRYLDEGQRVHWFGARGSKGQLLTVGDRHLMQLNLLGDYGSTEKLPKSLRGMFSGAGSADERRQIQDMMFEFRELRSRGRSLSPGERADMRFLEQELLQRGSGGGDVDIGDDYIPF